MTRTISSSVSDLVELLELENTRVVTRHQLRDLMGSETESGSLTRAIATLKTKGWLAPSGVRGVYEFIPGRRAGRFPSRDPLQPLRAALADSAELHAAVALGSALAFLNLSDRGPDLPEVAVAKGAPPPRGLLRHLRVVNHEWILPTKLIDALPVHQPATVLVHLAHRPTQVRSWGAILDVLPALTAAVTAEALAIELENRPGATRARLAYLIAGVAPALLAAITPTRPAGLVWFGPRRHTIRYDKTWNVADTILPMSPSAITAELP